ncbi:MAG: acyltransferase [Anaerolineales bacterium]|nr:acyltransferase [Anaerolineales bacterium]
MNTRANWVDYGKGIGIVLVVYAHLLSSAYHGGVQIPERFFNLSDSIVYGFHMPLFFFLSGLFVESSFRKRGAKDYLLDKFARIAYPYMIWSVLQVGVEVLFSNQTQRGATISDLFAVLYRPWGQFWFLYALLLMHVAYAVFSLFGKYSTLLMFAAAASLFFYSPTISLMAIFGFCAHFVFFAGGVLFKNQFLQADKYNIPLWVAILPLVVLIGSGYFIFENLIAPARLAGGAHPFYFLYLSILGIAACSVLSQYLAKRNAARFLQTLGRYSLQIYLVHMLAGVGIRMILLRVFGVQHWVVHIVVGVTFALAAPIILQKISDRLNFPYLFELRSGFFKTK